ncbi:hypothetical protein PAPHI01_2583 [Pancytospora philotis]|nr:hypothetical protein PAPHI01_2583 [Pancytospora philotis]
MLFLSSALSLAGSPVWARISLREAVDLAKSERKRADGGTEFYNPEGPLNILRAHALVSNDVIAKKRMYSPLIRTCYILDEIEDKDSMSKPVPGEDWNRVYKYERNPAKDEICRFTCSKEMDYLHAYSNTLKILFRICNGKVVVSTNHYMSFYKYTHVQLSDNDHIRLFAILILLASGRKIEAKYEQTMMMTSKNEKALKTSGISLTYDGNTILTLDLNIGNRRCKKPLYAEEVRTVVEFFAHHGATDVDMYGLHYTDSPSFLIQAYLCEYANDGAFIGKVFDCVEALLTETSAGPELDAARTRFFTTDRALVRRYSRQYEVFTKIDEINSRSQFPFTSSNMPLQNQLVYYFDEATGNVCKTVSYSDCLEIALYNFCCCMLYNPETRRYSTDHLGTRGCNPTERLVHFFTEICTGPEDNNKACIHQEWARIAQGLVLRPTGGEGRLNMIKYRKTSKQNTAVELSADMGNFLMALAVIMGLPETTKRELECFVADSLASPSSEVDCSRITRVLSDVVFSISTRAADPVFYGACIGGEKQDRICGTLEVQFPPQKDGQPSYKIELKFRPGHASFVYNPHSVTLDTEEREFITACGEEPTDEKSPLLCLIRDNARSFLSMADGTTLPNDHIAGVERAHDTMALYVALTRWLAHAPMRSHQDLLAAIDQLFPTFMRLVRHRNTTNGLSGHYTFQGGAEGHSTNLENESASVSDLVLTASNPVVLLIANILGSVSLNDYATRRLFFRAVLINCVSERAKVFPNIRIHPSLYSQEPAESRVTRETELWILADLRTPNIALHFLKQFAATMHGREAEWQQKEASIINGLDGADHRHACWLQAAKMFMAHKHTEGLKLVQECCMPDNGRATEEDRASRALWFYIAIKNHFYNEARWVCDGWTRLNCALFCQRWVGWQAFGESNMPALSERIISEIFPGGFTPPQLKALLDLYALFASSESEYAELYSMLEANTSSVDASFVAEICQRSVDAFLPLSSSVCESVPSDWATMLNLYCSCLLSFISDAAQLCSAEFDLTAESKEIFHECKQKLAECGNRLQRIL